MAGFFTLFSVRKTSISVKKKDTVAFSSVNLENKIPAERCD
jgi:hypothetical protein